MKSEKGASMVEFALVLPILILLLMGIVDFGRVFHAYLTIDHVGRELARHVSVNLLSDEQIDNKTNKIINDYKLNDTTIIVVDFDTEYKRGNNVEVNIWYTIDFLTPVIKPFFTNGLQLYDSTTMRIE